MSVSYDPTAHYEVEETDVEYLRHGDQGYLVRMYRPLGVSGVTPALLQVHGGQWSSSDRLQCERINRALASSGLLVAAIDFRLAPDHPYPQQVQDINYAVRWLKAHAAEYGADPATVGGMGASSGGHGIVLSAMRPYDPRYAALPLPEGPDLDATLSYVISCWGIVDPTARNAFAMANPNAGEGFGGAERLQRSTAGYFGDDATMSDGNPQHILDRGERVALPPLLVVQGDLDLNIPYQIPEKFAAAWNAAGGKPEFELFPGMKHSFGNQTGPEPERSYAVMQAFIARQVG